MATLMMDLRYAVRTNDATEDAGATSVTYIGLADPGTASSDAGWVVKKVLTYSDGSTATLFSNGLAKMNQIYDNYLTLTYK